MAAVIAEEEIAAQAEDFEAAETLRCPSTNTKSTNLNLDNYLERKPKDPYLSIYSTDLYQEVIDPVFGNQPIGRIWWR